MSNEKQQHTPGPWNVETEDGLFYVTGTHNGKKTYLVELFDHRSIERENSEANARLIAAAPKLLASLIKARDWFVDEYMIVVPEETSKYPFLVEMDAAIAEAKGE